MERRGNARGRSLLANSLRAVLGCLIGCVFLLSTACAPRSSPSAGRRPAAGSHRSGERHRARPFSPSLAWTSSELDGPLYARPVVYDRLVIAATEDDTLYGLDAGNGAVVWRKHLGTPVPRSDLPYGDISPSGITGTPALDRTSGTLYVVAFVTPGRHELFALDATTGKVLFSRPVDPPGSDPLVQQQRGALTLSRGRVYVPYGGLYGDCGDYHGWMVALPARGAGAMLSYEVPTEREGGIWAPFGAAVDSSGDLFVSTGNSASLGAFDYGNSVLRLSPDLRLLGYFAPSDWRTRNALDLDLGSTSPVLLPSGLVFQIGKKGVGYLLEADRLGGIGGQVFSAKVCGRALGGAAYSSSDLYIPCAGGLVTARVEGTGASAHFGVLWRSLAMDAGPPAVSGGHVWVVDVAGARLFALDAATGRAVFHADLGAATHFDTPDLSQGRVFVSAGRFLKAFRTHG